MNWAPPVKGQPATYGLKAKTEGERYLQDKEFGLLDSGRRKTFDSGMVRDTDEEKVDYLLVHDGPMFERWAAHLERGAKKYTPRNWMLANGEEELARFRSSAYRHFIQWLNGEQDEDHAAAVYFNINGFEYVKDQPPGYLNPTEEELIAEDDLAYYKSRTEELLKETSKLRKRAAMFEKAAFDRLPPEKYAPVDL